MKEMEIMSKKFDHMKPDRRSTWFKDLTQDQRDARLKRLRKRNRARKLLEASGHRALDHQEVIEYLLWAINGSLGWPKYAIRRLRVSRIGSVRQLESIIEHNEIVSEAWLKLLRRRQAMKDLDMAKTSEELASAYEYFLKNLPFAEDQA